MKIKSNVYPGLLFAATLALGGCTQKRSDLYHLTASNDYGIFAFTARKDTVICSNIENNALFVHNLYGINYLTISGKKQTPSRSREGQVKIQVILPGELKEGTYRFTSADPFYDCLTDESHCNSCCLAEIRPNGDTRSNTYNLDKSLQSIDGTLKITRVALSRYTDESDTGRISGTFYYKGSELSEFGRYSGSATGSFTNIPLSAFH